jgi:hypothetical protein
LMVRDHHSGKVVVHVAGWLDEHLLAHVAHRLAIIDDELMLVATGTAR